MAQINLKKSTLILDEYMHERVTIKLQKQHIETILSDIVEPFYHIMAEKNKETPFAVSLQEEYLYKLKFGLTTFTIEFLTQPLTKLEEKFHSIGIKHANAHLKVEDFIAYFFLWEQLVMNFIENLTVDQSKKLLFKHKLIITFHSLITLHTPHSHLISTLEREKSKPKNSPSDSSQTTKSAQPTKETPLKGQLMYQHIDIDKLQEMHLTDDQKMTAKEFLEQSEIEQGLIDNLMDIDREVEDMFYATRLISIEAARSISTLYASYAKVLNSTYEFKELGYAVQSLASLLLVLNYENLDDKQGRRLKISLESILKDLHDWLNHIFIEQSAIDIHYLDASLFSSIAQVELMANTNTSAAKEEPQTEEDDFELF